MTKKAEKLQKLQELSKCDTQTESEQMVLENWHHNRCVWHRIATNLQFVKKKHKSTKHNKAKHTKKALYMPAYR